MVRVIPPDGNEYQLTCSQVLRLASGVAVELPKYHGKLLHLGPIAAAVRN